tara:strand:+ start:499 stop:780 length:282 start_codon:yes stop_codon:yes gene_type:complete
MSKASKIKILLDGDSHTFEMNTDETILDVAIDNDIDMPYSCQSGVCTACQGRLLNGSVEMDVSDGLSEEEIDDGYILCCQSHPSSDTVEIEIE